MVFTTITKRGMPMLRYRTHDLCTLTDKKCDCGRTLARMGRITGRTDDMLIIRGVNVFPSQIENVMKTFPEVSSWYQIELTNPNHLDVVTLKAELNPDFDFDQVAKIEQLQKDIQAKCKTMLSVGIKVKLVEPMTIARSEGKAKRVIDMRTGVFND